MSDDRKNAFELIGRVKDFERSWSATGLTPKAGPLVVAMGDASTGSR